MPISYVTLLYFTPGITNDVNLMMLNSLIVETLHNTIYITENSYLVTQLLGEIGDVY